MKTMSAEPTLGPTLVTYDASHEVHRDPPAHYAVLGSVSHHNATPSFSDVAALLDSGIDTKPGQLICVWHGRRHSGLLTVLQVEDCIEHNPNEEPDLATARRRLGLGDSYSSEEFSTRIHRLALCRTIEELTVNESASGVTLLETRAPEALVRAGDPVVLLPPEFTAAVLGSLPSPDDGIHVGDLHGPQSPPIAFKPVAAQLHIGVFGNPGRGKSYLAGNIVEELHAWGVPCLIVDVNGEMVEAVRELGGTSITLPNADAFGLSLSLITPRELVSIAPNVAEGTQYAELIEEAHSRLRDRAKRDGSEISFAQLIAEMERLGPDLELKRVSISAAVSRVRYLSSNPLIGRNFDFIKELKKRRVIALDCRFLSLRDTQLIAASAARVLQQHGRAMSQKAEAGDAEAAEWFATLLIDEAHMIVPGDDRTVSTQVIYELARMGRHVRTGLILASQSPADLDQSVLKRLQTRFIFALERDQLRSIGGVVADLGERLLSAIPKLPRGICAVSGVSEVVSHGFLMKVRARQTSVGGSTPQVFARRQKCRRA
jgi:DNA helicase HerA-like ATPase